MPSAQRLTMNLIDSSFLCLDLGSSAVRALGVRVRGGRVAQSVLKICESPDTAFALKTAVDELESQLGKHFESAYVTGDFGFARSAIINKTTEWGGARKISANDIGKQISEILFDLQNANEAPLHIIPLRYDIPGFKNISLPVGQTDCALSSVFHVISYSREDMHSAQSVLRTAHIESAGFFDPAVLIGMAARKSAAPAVFIDLGAAWTTVSCWTARGIVSLSKIPMGQIKITNDIADRLRIPFPDAEKIKVASLVAASSEMDRFAVADAGYELSRADVCDAGLPALREIMELARAELARHIEKYGPSAVYISGGGTNIPGIENLAGEMFGLPVHNLGADAAVAACAKQIWQNDAARAKHYVARREKWGRLLSWLPKIFRRRKIAKTPAFIPIMPSTQGFNMRSPTTYKLFESGGISMIHCDVMDGFYVNRITGSMDELRFIREHTNAHLNVHLMTENPIIWAEQAAAAGADTIIISTGTNGARAALKKIRELGKRAGIALHPDSPLEILKPILKEVDEILVMSIRPGPNGQEFLPDAVYRISTLANTRRKYGLCFKISVDGGINPATAKLCWAAGADFLASASYLANAADFPLAVQSLLRKE